jgi:uncharacterized protein YdiU (UPF0061 family)
MHVAARDLFLDREAYDKWLAGYQQRLDAEHIESDSRDAELNRTNPKFILRNYLAETAIRKAEDDGDYSEIDLLMQLLQKPFDEHPAHENYAGHPPEWASRIEVSCSS